MSEFVLEYEYDGRLLASEKSESRPVLAWWCSASPAGWYEKIPVEWRDEEKCFSKKHQVKIPLKGGSFWKDDIIGVLVFVDTPNHTGRKVPIKAGTSCFFLHSLMDTGEGELLLEMPTVSNNKGEKLVKGALKGRLVKKPSFFSFKETTRFSPTTENGDFLDVLLQSIGVKLMAPLDANIAGEIGLRGCMQPSDPTVEGMHAPYYTNEVGNLPGDMYWVNYTFPEVAPDEGFMVKLLEVNLKRHRTSRKELEAAIENQLKRDDDVLTEAFFDASVFLTDLVCTPSTMLPYVGDYTHLAHRGDIRKDLVKKKTGVSGRNKEGEEENPDKRMSIEYFNDALLDEGGDCEDMANLIHKIYSRLKYGVPDLANPNEPHTQHGSWHDPTLRSLQKMCYLYVGLGSLGTVTARFLGEKKDGKLPKIGSEEDLNAEVGGHMWWELTPVKKVEALMHASSASSSEPFRLYPQQPQRAWEDKLPILVGEGTGMLSPLLRPISTYTFENKAHAERAIRKHKKGLAALRLISHFDTLSELRTTRLQPMIKDVPGVRLSSFYRATNHAETDEFFKEGYNYGGFTWVYNKGSDQPWAYGVNMRHKLEGNPSVQLVLHPEFTEEEVNYCKSVFRLSMPSANPTFDAKFSSDVSSRYSSHLKQMTSSIKLSSSSPKSDDDIFYYNFYLETIPEEMDNEKFRASVVKELSQVKHLVSVNFETEVLTKELRDVRMELGFSFTDAEVEKILASKAPQKKKKSTSVDSVASFIGIDYHNEKYLSSKKLFLAGRDEEGEEEEEEGGNEEFSLIEVTPELGLDYEKDFYHMCDPRTGKEEDEGVDIPFVEVDFNKFKNAWKKFKDEGEKEEDRDRLPFLFVIRDNSSGKYVGMCFGFPPRWLEDGKTPLEFAIRHSLGQYYYFYPSVYSELVMERVKSGKTRPSYLENRSPVQKQRELEELFVRAKQLIPPMRAYDPSSDEPLEVYESAKAARAENLETVAREIAQRACDFAYDPKDNTSLASNLQKDYLFFPEKDTLSSYDTYIALLCISPEERGHHLADALLYRAGERTKALAKVYNFKKATLSLIPNTEKLGGFYARLGFAGTGFLNYVRSADLFSSPLSVKKEHRVRQRFIESFEGKRKQEDRDEEDEEEDDDTGEPELKQLRAIPDISRFPLSAPVDQEAEYYKMVNKMLNNPPDNIKKKVKNFAAPLEKNNYILVKWTPSSKGSPSFLQLYGRRKPESQLDGGDEEAILFMGFLDGLGYPYFYEGTSVASEWNLTEWLEHGRAYAQSERKRLAGYTPSILGMGVRLLIDYVSDSGHELLKVLDLPKIVAFPSTMDANVAVEDESAWPSWPSGESFGALMEYEVLESVVVDEDDDDEESTSTGHAFSIATYANRRDHLAAINLQLNKDKLLEKDENDTFIPWKMQDNNQNGKLEKALSTALYEVLDSVHDEGFEEFRIEKVHKSAVALGRWELGYMDTWSCEWHMKNMFEDDEQPDAFKSELKDTPWAIVRWRQHDESDELVRLGGSPFYVFYGGLSASIAGVREQLDGLLMNFEGRSFADIGTGTGAKNVKLGWTYAQCERFLTRGEWPNKKGAEWIPEVVARDPSYFDPDNHPHSAPAASHLGDPIDVEEYMDDKPVHDLAEFCQTGDDVDDYLAHVKRYLIEDGVVAASAEARAGEARALTFEELYWCVITWHPKHTVVEDLSKEPVRSYGGELIQLGGEWMLFAWAFPVDRAALKGFEKALKGETVKGADSRNDTLMLGWTQGEKLVKEIDERGFRVGGVRSNLPSQVPETVPVDAPLELEVKVSPDAFVLKNMPDLDHFRWSQLGRRFYEGMKAEDPEVDASWSWVIVLLTNSYKRDKFSEKWDHEFVDAKEARLTTRFFFLFYLIKSDEEEILRGFVKGIKGPHIDSEDRKRYGWITGGRDAFHYGWKRGNKYYRENANIEQARHSWRYFEVVKVEAKFVLPEKIVFPSKTPRPILPLTASTPLVSGMENLSLNATTKATIDAFPREKRSTPLLPPLAPSIYSPPSPSPPSQNSKTTAPTQDIGLEWLQDNGISIIDPNEDNPYIQEHQEILDGAIDKARAYVKSSPEFPWVVIVGYEGFAQGDFFAEFSAFASKEQAEAYIAGVREGSFDKGPPREFSNLQKRAWRRGVNERVILDKVGTVEWYRKL